MGKGEIKPVYSDITLSILDKVRLEETLREIHTLRKERGLLDKPDDYVLLNGMKGHLNYNKRVLKRKENIARKKELKAFLKEAQKKARAEFKARGVNG